MDVMDSRRAVRRSTAWIQERVSQVVEDSEQESGGEVVPLFPSISTRKKKLKKKEENKMNVVAVVVTSVVFNMIFRKVLKVGLKQKIESLNDVERARFEEMVANIKMGEK